VPGALLRRRLRNRTRKYDGNTLVILSYRATICQGGYQKKKQIRPAVRIIARTDSFASVVFSIPKIGRLCRFHTDRRSYGRPVIVSASNFFDDVPERLNTSRLLRSTIKKRTTSREYVFVPNLGRHDCHTRVVEFFRFCPPYFYGPPDHRGRRTRSIRS